MNTQLLSIFVTIIHIEENVGKLNFVIQSERTQFRSVYILQVIYKVQYVK